MYRKPKNKIMILISFSGGKRFFINGVALKRNSFKFVNY